MSHCAKSSEYGVRLRVKMPFLVQINPGTSSNDDKEHYQPTSFFRVIRNHSMNTVLWCCPLIDGATRKWCFEKVPFSAGHTVYILIHSRAVFPKLFFVLCPVYAFLKILCFAPLAIIFNVQKFKFSLKRQEWYINYLSFSNGPFLGRRSHG